MTTIHGTNPLNDDNPQLLSRHKVKQIAWWPSLVRCLRCGRDFDLNEPSQSHQARFGKCGEVA